VARASRVLGRTKAAVLTAEPCHTPSRLSFLTEESVRLSLHVGDVGCTQRIEYLRNNSIRRMNEIEVTFLCSLITWFTRLQLIHVTHAHWPNQQECQMARA
jgi:hypothetical protein